MPHLLACTPAEYRGGCAALLEWGRTVTDPRSLPLRCRWRHPNGSGRSSTKGDGVVDEQDPEGRSGRRRERSGCGRPFVVIVRLLRLPSQRRAVAPLLLSSLWPGMASTSVASSSPPSSSSRSRRLLAGCRVSSRIRLPSSFRRLSSPVRPLLSSPPGPSCTSPRPL